MIEWGSLFARFLMMMWCGLLFTVFAQLAWSFKPDPGAEIYLLLIASIPLAGFSLLAIWAGWSAFRLCREDWRMRNLLADMKGERPAYIVLAVVDGLLLITAFSTWGAVGWFWLRVAPPLAGFMIEGLMYRLFGA